MMSRPIAARSPWLVWTCLMAGCLADWSLCAGAAEAPGGEKNLQLDAMVARTKPGTIPGVSGNASGITFSPVFGTFFVIVNSPTEIVELGADGKKVRSIRLQGFSDTEGITHVESNTFAVIEEDRGTLTLVTIDEKTTRVSSRDGRSIKVDNVGGNKGLEGITYDPLEKCFYLVKEKSPRKIYKVTMDGKVSNPWDIEKASLSLRDLSDLYFDPVSRHLVLLSHESATAVECTVDGREISRLSLKLAQAEGVTMDSKRNLYICGEPSVLQSFAKP